MSNCEKCGYYSDGECNICGMGISGEDTFCRLCKDNPNCYYKQLSELKTENERLKELFEIESLTNIKTGETMYRSRQLIHFVDILQEIKTIAEQCMNKDTCYDCEYFNDCYIEDAEIPTYDICKLLIQKITKAEEK